MIRIEVRGRDNLQVEESPSPDEKLNFDILITESVFNFILQVRPFCTAAVPIWNLLMAVSDEKKTAVCAKVLKARNAPFGHYIVFWLAIKKVFLAII